MSQPTGHGTTRPNQESQRCKSSQRASTCTASVHGTRVAYDTYRCRCPDARAASSRARKARAARQYRGGQGLVEPTGTVRRLRALAAIGWSPELLGRELSCTRQRVRHLRDARTPHVNIATHATVKWLYARLADTPGTSDRTRLHAERRGWLAPIWWDDDHIDDPAYNPLMLLLKDAQGTPMSTRITNDSGDEIIDQIAVERACSDDPDRPLPTLNRAEKQAAIRRILAAGHNKTEAARRLKLSGRTVNELLEASTSLPLSVGGCADPSPMTYDHAEEAS